MQTGIACVCPVISRTFRGRKSLKQTFFYSYYHWNYIKSVKTHGITSCSFSTGDYDCSNAEPFTAYPQSATIANASAKDEEVGSTNHMKSGTDAQTQSKPDFPTVGVVFDIDGVLVRGRKVIKEAKEAINLLETHKVPFMYLTNSGCETEEHKAQSLEKHLGITIDPDQVVLSHSPLRILDILHDKHVVVSGQGPVSQIAEMCGFSKVSHVDDIDCHFPELDVNDRKKRDRMPSAPKRPFAPVEAIVLMGEPVNWEKSLQIMIDIILADGGMPNRKHSKITQQLPVVAVNTDYLWMSEAINPRFGHGGFLLCLESLFMKLTGRRLEYTAVLGKPNLFTYRYTEGVLLKLARKMFGAEARIKTIYAVGDNPNTDIYGANLYNNYLKAIQGSNIVTNPLQPNSSIRPQRMKSVLVQTGVFGSDASGVWEHDVNHLHRDTMFRHELTVPTHTCKHVLEAVETVLTEEGIR